MAPQWRVAGPLEQAYSRSADHRLAVIVRQGRIDKDRVRRAVDPACQRRRQQPEPVFADIHIGAERPAAVGIHVGHEHLGDRTTIQHHALAPLIGKAEQRQDQPGAPVHAKMERPFVPAHLIAIEGKAYFCPTFGGRRRERLGKRVGVPADRNCPGVDQPDHLFLVEIDDCIEPLDRPAPEIGTAAHRIEAGHLEEAATFLCRIGEITGREGRAKEVLERSVAALSHCHLPSGVGARNALGVLPLLGQDPALDMRDRLPAHELARAEIDHRFVDSAVASGDDERPADKGLSGIPCKHIGLGRLVEIDQRKPGLRVDFAGCAQRRDRSRDLPTRQRVKRMSSKGARAVQNDQRRHESPAQSGVAHQP